MSRKGVFVLTGCTVVIMIVAGLYLAYRTFLPVNPIEPYFTYKSDRISEL
jgi:hypothetical protein